MTRLTTAAYTPLIGESRWIFIVSWENSRYSIMNLFLSLYFLHLSPYKNISRLSSFIYFLSSTSLSVSVSLSPFVSLTPAFCLSPFFTLILFYFQTPRCPPPHTSSLSLPPLSLSFSDLLFSFAPSIFFTLFHIIYRCIYDHIDYVLFMCAFVSQYIHIPEPNLKQMLFSSFVT